MKKQADGKRYRAVTLLWHSREERYVEPGSEVDLSHLGDEAVQRLIKLGAVEALPLAATSTTYTIDTVKEE